jgi:Lon protease-like protein
MFPDALYPLHIFEERYKKMTNRCIDNDEYLGIVAKIETDISNVGCLVKVSKVLKTFENGSMDIIVKGYSRFMVETTGLHPDGYIEAEIVLFGDSDYSRSNDDIYKKTISVFKNILDRTSLKMGDNFWKNLKSTDDKSFKIAEKSGLNLRQQQEVLSLRSEKDRLNYLYRHLEKLETTLERSEVLKDIIAADGYLNEL